MNKELQDKAWSVLPKEFKEEVKKYFAHYRCALNTHEAIINHIFGRHNLTSDAEGEEMLTANKKDVQEQYALQVAALRKGNLSDMEVECRVKLKDMLYFLFGSKCLPEEVVVAENATASEPKPAEPKFTKGDMVHCKSFGYEGDYKVLEYTGGPRNCYDCIDKYGAYYRFYDSDLEPYTEPEEDKAEEIANKAIEPVEKHFDNILKDGFSKERRLNVAAMAMQGILSNEVSQDVANMDSESHQYPESIAKYAVACADALIAELNKTKKEL